METLDVKIMGRDFRVACTPLEKEALLRAVQVVDVKMNTIRELGRVVGVDRIAVMAALQIAHEAIQQQSGQGSPGLGLDIPVLERKIQHIGDNIDQALAGTISSAASVQAPD
ncbi:MAG: cell division protein ZapA [Burkholderiaceae bacterium]|jgi:cell division protein ZapA